MRVRAPMLLVVILAGCGDHSGTATAPEEAVTSQHSGSKPPRPGKYDENAIYVFCDDRDPRNRFMVAFQGMHCAAQVWNFLSGTQKRRFESKSTHPDLMKLVRIWAARQADHALPGLPHEFDGLPMRAIILANKNQFNNEFFDEASETANFFEELKSGLMTAENRTEALPAFVSSSRDVRMFFGEYSDSPSP